MRKRILSFFPVLMITAGLLLVPVPAQASAPIWDVTAHVSSQVAITQDNGVANVTVPCPSGKTPISGHVNPPPSGDDLRLQIENVGFGSGATYFVRVQDQTPGTGTILITTTVRCVSVSAFSNQVSVNNFANPFPVDDSSHLAQGSLSCPSGWAALSSARDMGTSAGATLLTSTPTSNLSGWHAAGYHDSVSNVLRMTVHCVPSGDLSGIIVTSHTDNTTFWGQEATATCPSGLAPMFGGTQDLSADGGAISYYSRPSANGWTSGTGAFSASIFTVVACKPASNPTIALSGSSGYSPSTTASWTFSGSDPASAGGYSLGFVCTYTHLGVADPAATCSSPVTKTGLAEGAYTLSVYAETSDGRRSAAQALTVRIDHTAPTITSPNDGGIVGTGSPTLMFQSSDASPVNLNECWLDGAAPTTCDTANPFTGGSHFVTLSNLGEGAHVLHVRATDAAGNVGAHDIAFTVDTSAPTAVFADAPGALENTTSPSLGFTTSDAITRVVALSCWVDAATPAPCGTATGGDYSGTQSFVSGTLGQGDHTVHVRPTDDAGNSATYDLSIKVDTVAPTVTMTRPTAPLNRTQSLTAGWSGSDAVAGVAHYVVRWRRAPYNAGFGAYSSPVTLPATTTSRSYSSLAQGSTYCYSTRAQDRAGNLGRYATERCSAIPLDDRSLSRSSGWSATTPTGWFKGTALSTKTKGAQLSKSGVQLKRSGVIAMTCPSCGVVGVFVGATRVGTINLYSSTTRRVLKTVPTFTFRSGTVTLRVLSSAKLVRLDALLVSRR